MASNMDGIIKKLISAMQTTSKAKTSGYDTSAVVRRIEDGTAWVHIPGGVDETPVKLTIAARVGDVVQVRVADGRAFLVGNATAPPTDDALAVIAQYQADYANQLAALAKQSAENAENIAVQAYNTILIEYAVSPDDKYAEAIRAAENDYIRVTEDDFVRDVDLTIDGWYTEIPEIPEGYYLWTRITSTAEDGSTSVVYTVSAPGVAMEAKNTADAAQAAAEDAQAAAEDAKKVANNYLSADTTGIMVADLADGPQTPSTATGRNLKIDNEGVYVRDGQSELARFRADGAQVGADDAPHMLLSNKAIIGYDETLVPFFTVNMNGGTMSASRKWFAGSIEEQTKSISTAEILYGQTVVELGDLAAGTAVNIAGYFATSDGTWGVGTVTTESNCDVFFKSDIGTSVMAVSITPFQVVAGTAKTQTCSGTVKNINNASLSFRIVFAYNPTAETMTVSVYFSATISSTISGFGGTFSGHYVVTAAAPSYIFGDDYGQAIGAYSAVIGKGLDAPYSGQVAVGAYNADTYGANFVVGSGYEEDGTETRETSFAVVGGGDLLFRLNTEIFYPSTGSDDEQIAVLLSNKGWLTNVMTSDGQMLDVKKMLIKILESL